MAVPTTQPIQNTVLPQVNPATQGGMNPQNGPNTTHLPMLENALNNSPPPNTSGNIQGIGIGSGMDWSSIGQNRPIAGGMGTPKQGSQPTSGAPTKPATLGKPAAPQQSVVSAPNTGMTAPVAPPQQTAGGLSGNIRPPQYGPSTGMNGGAGASGGMSGGYSHGAPRQNPNDGFNRYDEFRDSALSQAMRGLQPQIDSNNERFEQMMVGRGIQAGTEQYDRQRALLDRGNNDMLAQANYGAQQQGLAAQNQAWNQGFQYDSLANALNQAQIGANASMFNASTGANASMYGSQLAHALGTNQLNEQGYQFDVNDIYRNQQLGLQGALGFGQLGLGQQQQDLNAFNANQAANNQWWNQIGGFTANAPGVMFNPTGDVAGSMQNAGQNMANAQAQQNQMLGDLVGGLMPMSDVRLKENIRFVKSVEDVNVYEFDYIDKTLGKGRYRGVMAQEVQETHPDAIYNYDGYLAVDYSQLPVDMEEVQETHPDYNQLPVDMEEV